MRLFTHEALSRVYLYDTATVTSSPALERSLSGATSYSLMALCDEVDRAGTLTAWLQHSPDGDTWVDVSVTPEISSGAIDVSAVTLLAGSFMGSAVALGPRVRVAARLASTNVARVTLLVTGRGTRRVAPSGASAGCGCGGSCGAAEGGESAAALFQGAPPAPRPGPPRPAAEAETPGYHHCRRCSAAAHKRWKQEILACHEQYDEACFFCQSQGASCNDEKTCAAKQNRTKCIDTANCWANGRLDTCEAMVEGGCGYDRRLPISKGFECPFTF